MYACIFVAAIFQSLHKVFGLLEFKDMMDNIDQVNLSVSLLNEFYELKSSMQQEHLLNLTAQNKEMMKTLENLNNSLSRRLLSQASRIQKLSILTAAEMSCINSEIGTVKENINQLRSNVNSEIRTNIGRLRMETYNNITNSHSMLRGSLNAVQITARTLDTRTTPIAGDRVLVNYVTQRKQNRSFLPRNQKRTISVSHTIHSVSYMYKQNQQ